MPNRIHKSRLILAVVLIGLGNQCTVRLAHAEEASSADRIKALVEQLSDDESAKREQAEKALIQLGLKGGPDSGDAFIDKLPKPNDEMPQEVQARLARIATEVRSRMAKKGIEA